MGTPKTTRRESPNPDAIKIRKIKAAFASALKDTEQLDMAVRKVMGIMRNAALSTSADDLRHRLRLVVGHRHAIRKTYEVFQNAMFLVSQLEATEG